MWSAPQLSCSQHVWDSSQHTPTQHWCRFLRGLMTCVSVCRTDRLSLAECRRTLREDGREMTTSAVWPGHPAAYWDTAAKVARILEWWTDNSCTLIQCHYSWCLTAQFTGSLHHVGHLRPQRLLLWVDPYDELYTGQDSSTLWRGRAVRLATLRGKMQGRKSILRFTMAR